MLIVACVPTVVKKPGRSQQRLEGRQRSAALGKPSAAASPAWNVIVQRAVQRLFRSLALRRPPGPHRRRSQRGDGNPFRCRSHRSTGRIQASSRGRLINRSPCVAGRTRSPTCVRHRVAGRKAGHGRRSAGEGVEGVYPYPDSRAGPAAYLDLFAETTVGKWISGRRPVSQSGLAINKGASPNRSRRDGIEISR